MLLDCRREKRVLGLIGSGSWVSTDRHSHLPSGLPGCRGCCSCVSAQPSWQGWVFSSTLPPALLVSKLVFSLRLFAVIFWSNLTNVYVTENDALRSLKGKKKNFLWQVEPCLLTYLKYSFTTRCRDLTMICTLAQAFYPTLMLIRHIYTHIHTKEIDFFFLPPSISVCPFAHWYLLNACTGGHFVKMGFGHLCVKKQKFWKLTANLSVGRVSGQLWATISISVA